jgi:hypothetical protein
MKRIMAALLFAATLTSFADDAPADPTLGAWVFPWDNYSGPAIGPFRTLPEARRDGCQVWIFTQDPLAEGFRVTLAYQYENVEGVSRTSTLVARESRMPNMPERWTSYIFEFPEFPKMRCLGVEVISLHAHSKTGGVE